MPSRLGPYRLLEVLGEGGMGTVYLAEETESLKRRVAVKWIRAALAGASAIRRFDAERRALARMNHPSIAQVYEAGTDGDGRPYIVMEYVPGGRITEYCTRSKPPLDVVLGLLADLGRGLYHAHRQGIVHRDVKPSNVLVAEDPHEGPTPKIIDFGLAKLLDATVQLTRPGDVLGTPAYMSPEQVRGDPVDHRTDVYAFGVLTRELVTGEGRAKCPAGLERIVETCTATDPEERYDDFSVLVDDLEALRAKYASPAAEAPQEDVTEALREIFEAGASPAAERLLEVFEEAAARSPELLRWTVEEAGRLRESYRETVRARRLLVEATADYYLGSALSGFVLTGEGEEARASFTRAAETFREAHETQPEILDALDYVRWGDALLQLAEPEDVEEAVEAYRRALDLDERCAAARYGLALAGLRGGDPPEEWMGAASRVLALEPGTAAGNNHLGVVLYESRRYPEVSLYGRDKLAEAVSAFEKALALAPESAVVHFNLGLALRTRGEGQKARQAFRRAGRLGWNVEESVAEDDSRPVEILPYLDPRRLGGPDDDTAELYRRGSALAREDPSEARDAFARAQSHRK